LALRLVQSFGRRSARYWMFTHMYALNGDPNISDRALPLVSAW